MIDNASLIPHENKYFECSFFEGGCGTQTFQEVWKQL